MMSSGITRPGCETGIGEGYLALERARSLHRIRNAQARRPTRDARGCAQVRRKV
jgi:hypothetical protein